MPELNKNQVAKSKNELRREHMERQRAVKRRRRILAYCVIIFILLVIFTILAFTVFLRIGQINISGKTNYTREEIIEASGLEVGDQLYLFSTDKAEKRITESLPYIEKAEITRKISGKVSVSVTAAKAQYVMAYGEKYAVLGDDGKVLGITDKAKIKGKTLVITGAALKNATPGEKTLQFSDEKDDKRETAETFEKILNVINTTGLKDIVEINMTKKNNITMNYQNRIVLKFGSVDKLESKAKLAVKALEKENNISFDQKGTLDLRVVNKEAVFSAAEE